MPKTLVTLLADGLFHSGQELGAQLGVGRAAIWKQVQALSGRGLEVSAVRGRGYQIKGGLDLLDIGEIWRQLGPVASELLTEIELADLVDSTNEVALSRIRAAPSNGYVCLAEQQSAGRGRRGRSWTSPYAKNIYASLTWRFDGGLPAIQGLSIAVGIAICQAVESLGGAGVLLKWPNDVCFHGAKLCGILIEAVGDMGGECTVVVGIGVNVMMRDDDAAGIDQPWTDLAGMGVSKSRSEVAATLLSFLADSVASFQKVGLSGVMAEWSRLDALSGREIEVHIGERVICGVGAGIDHTGALLLDTADGRQTFLAGEVSVRGWQ